VNEFLNLLFSLVIGILVDEPSNKPNE